MIFNKQKREDNSEINNYFNLKINVFYYICLYGIFTLLFIGLMLSLFITVDETINVHLVINPINNTSVITHNTNDEIKETNLITQIYIPYSDINKVKVGDYVKIIISTNLNMNDDYINGVISQIRNEGMINEEQNHNYYLVEANIILETPNYVVSENIIGMPIEASIITHKMNILEYLIRKMNIIK